MELGQNQKGKGRGWAPPYDGGMDDMYEQGACSIHRTDGKVHSSRTSTRAMRVSKGWATVREDSFTAMTTTMGIAVTMRPDICTSKTPNACNTNSGGSQRLATKDMGGQDTCTQHLDRAVLMGMYTGPFRGGMGMMSLLWASLLRVQITQRVPWGTPLPGVLQGGFAKETAEGHGRQAPTRGHMPPGILVGRSPPHL